MNEVEKLYELAGIEPYRICNSCIDDNGNMITNSKNCSFRNFCGNACDVPHYDLTAKKQLELIKWLIHYPMIDEMGMYFNEPSKTYNIKVLSLPEESGYQSSYTETHNTFEQTISYFFLLGFG